MIIHLNKQTFAAGDVIQPGNFGRLLRELHKAEAGNNGRVYVLGMVAREYLFEVIRRDVKPLAPSRLTCIFACPSEQDAELYAAENNPGARAYEVEPINPDAAVHVAAISHCAMTSGSSFIDQMEPKAYRYWDGKPGDPEKGREILFSCSLRVVRSL